MRKTSCSVFGLFLFIATPSLAGWGSSGGEFLRDSQNPWWVKNTSVIRYCVAIDQRGFSAPLEKAQALIRSSLQFWKSEFSRKVGYLKNGDMLMKTFELAGIGSQEFIQGDCDGHEDLKFQLGFGTLSEEQRRKIPDFRSYAGMAVRTEYDAEKMRGRGFVYIASDIGPNRYDTEAELIDEAWRHDVLLSMILIHELGHVFGIPHVENSVMGQRTPEIVMSRLFSKFYLEASSRGDALKGVTVFFPASEFGVCSPEGKDLGTDYPAAGRFFGVPAGMGCLFFALDDATGKITVSTSPNGHGNRARLGEITEMIYRGQANPAVLLWLSPRQKIIPSLPGWPIVAGPFFLDIDGTRGIYRKDGDSTGKAISLSRDPIRVRMQGYAEGRIEDLVNLTSTGL